MAFSVCGNDQEFFMHHYVSIFYYVFGKIIKWYLKGGQKSTKWTFTYMYVYISFAYLTPCRKFNMIHELKLNENWKR